MCAQTSASVDLRLGHNALGSLQQGFQTNSQIYAMFNAIPQRELIDNDGPEGEPARRDQNAAHGGTALTQLWIAIGGIA